MTRYGICPTHGRPNSAGGGCLVCDDKKRLRAEMDRLRTENERLRAALRAAADDRAGGSDA